jgi:hypothetical protein
MAFEFQDGKDMHYSNRHQMFFHKNKSIKNLDAD